MSKSQPHEEFRRLIDRIIMTVAIELAIKIKGLGEFDVEAVRDPTWD